MTCYDDPDYLNADLIDEIKYMRGLSDLGRLSKLDHMYQLRFNCTERYTMATTQSAMVFWNYIAQLQG